MFAPPPRITASVFARLPDHLRRPAPDSEFHRHQPGNLAAHSLLEGPAFDRQGRLWCVDIPWGRIFRVAQTGEFSLIAEYDGEPNGLKFHPDGRAFIADYKNGIMAMDPDTGAITPVLERVRLERLKAVNDLVFAANGDLYFTDQGLTGLHDASGRVFRLRRDDTAEVPVPSAGQRSHAQAVRGNQRASLRAGAADASRHDRGRGHQPEMHQTKKRSPIF